MQEPQRPFLDVEQSVLGNRWSERANRFQLGQAEAMATAHGVPEIVARVLAGRGVLAEDTATFLAPTLRDLMPDPSTLTDMDAAADRIARAIHAGERVAIFGDYDVDGATSSALMALYLRHFGISAEIYIPERIFEGYGPNAPALRELAERGATLLITVDCGSTSVDVLGGAKALGMDVVVLDHHQVGDALPSVEALVNPNREDDLSGQGHICAAGVTFLTLVALNRHFRRVENIAQDKLPNLMDWLDLVALGTVCDVVPLTGLNRAYVVRGLDVMRRQNNPGLVALARVAKQDGPPTPFHLGFILGPRINAGGRIGDAALGARLLTTTDTTEAEAIAERLHGLNAERQAMEKAMLKQAMEEAEAETMTGEGPSVLIVQSDTWHAGVVGLLASRLKDKFKRPSFAITFDDRGIGSGSGRSIPGVDLGAAVRAAVEIGIAQKGGGHAMAAGVTLDRARLGDFRAHMENALAKAVTQNTARHELKIDAALSARGVSLDLMDQLEKAGPYGASHSQPLFAFPRHTLRYADVVGTNHVRLSLHSADGAELRGIAFNAANTALGETLLASRGQPLHFAGNLNADFYQGSKRIQLRVADAAIVPDRM
ncbi:MAG: single-stranded-DNA-specific exonuclease RecJ [Pseudomonadota bacterium]